jgi:hypothetical protein
MRKPAAHACVAENMNQIAGTTAHSESIRSLVKFDSDVVAEKTALCQMTMLGNRIDLVWQLGSGQHQQAKRRMEVERLTIKALLRGNCVRNRTSGRDRSLRSTSPLSLILLWTSLIAGRSGNAYSIRYIPQELSILIKASPVSGANRVGRGGHIDVGGNRHSLTRRRVNVGIPRSEGHRRGV